MLHIDLPTTADLKSLIERRADACVSLYLPTHAVTQHTDIDRLEFRRLAEAAVQQLRDGGINSQRIAAIEDNLSDLSDDYEFWRFQATSLAVLATPDSLMTYRLPSRLQPTIEVCDRFHLRPMIRAVSFPGAAFVLALSENAARLIEVTPDGPAEEVAVPDMPTSLAQVISRTDRRSPESPTRQGGEGQKVLIRKYAREVDAAIRALLAGRTTPLFLACVESLAPIYRSVNSYAYLAEEIIAGNVEHLSSRELAEQARDIQRQHNERAVALLRDRYEAWTGSGRATSDLAQVARAASSGAVHTLLFDINGALPGRMDEQTGAIDVEPQASASSYDIVDEIVARTILYGGEVVGVRYGDLPSPNSPVAALLRFPM
jgi:hypothetical protein